MPKMPKNERTPFRNRGRLGLLLAMALVALTPAPAGAARLPKACELLTNAQVRSALGAKIQYRTQTPNQLNSCTWHAVPFSSATSAHAQLDLDVSRTTEKRFKQGWNRVRAIPLRGVGDAAYSMQNGEVLAVWQDGIALTISIYFTTTPLETGKRVAREALMNL
jgi:hypothetical protein